LPNICSPVQRLEGAQTLGSDHDLRLSFVVTLLDPAKRSKALKLKHGPAAASISISIKSKV